MRLAKHLPAGRFRKGKLRARRFQTDVVHLQCSILQEFFRAWNTGNKTNPLFMEALTVVDDAINSHCSGCKFWAPASFRERSYTEWFRYIACAASIMVGVGAYRAFCHVDNERGASCRMESVAVIAVAMLSWLQCKGMEILSCINWMLTGWTAPSVATTIGIR